MELIPYTQFAKLRLKQFVGNDVEITEDEQADLEWMGGLWINEGVDGATFARWENTPDELGGFEFWFSAIPASASRSILEAINFPLQPGATLAELESVLGVPDKSDSLTEWNNYDFTIGQKQPYYVSCTVDHTKGLTGLTVIRKDVL